MRCGLLEGVEQVLHSLFVDHGHRLEGSSLLTSSASVSYLWSFEELAEYGVLTLDEQLRVGNCLKYCRSWNHTWVFSLYH